MRILSISTVFLVLYITGCSNTQVTSGLLEHDQFSIHLPPDCRYVKSDYLDSEYGEVECGKLLISYDYGYCNYSTHTVLSVQDYLDKNRWLVEVIPTLVPSNAETSLDTIFEKIKVLSVDRVRLIGKIEYEGKVYEHKIMLPHDVINLSERKDTTDGIITRVIYDDRVKEVNCYKINTLKFNSDKTCNEALIIRIKSDEALDSLVVTDILGSIQFPLILSD